MVRFFLLGHQIDPSYFLNILDRLEALARHFATEATRDDKLLVQIVNLIQTCMSIHSGHPEKYQPVSEMIKDVEIESEGKLAFDSELRIDAARLSEAWLPIDQQRQVFT